MCNVKPNQRFVILDCDGGSDDAWALLLLLRAEQLGYLELLAVTTTGCGNTTNENTARNMRRILQACGREDVPIYLGAVEPLKGFIADLKYFHGRDGFGDCLEDANFGPVSNFVQSKHAVTAIYELCQSRPQQITVFAVGPLTNLALGYSMYGEQFGHFIKDICIMGGNYRGVGNSSRAAEFNFHADPEAAHAVLLKTRCPITILPWEPCTNMNISINWQELGANVNKLAIDILTQVASSRWKNGVGCFAPCDAMLVAVWLFDKQFVKRDSTWHATVDLTGTHTRGQMVLDHLREVEKFPENVRIIELIEPEFFKRVVEWVAGLKHASCDLKPFC